ncbi:hypothetical protein PoB_002945500 [Plakobranchus ocellatus]|uniref:ZSWIM1/3 RNaseH-like domain-containing protein n=1 Tax=Plakobranchus ocellatus TaxID=259542 RepID=A0AAV4A4A1_9GAST|nr:hypothetical protein PoB_002945500 [Plakobranchus ocellatus]
MVLPENRHLQLNSTTSLLTTTSLKVSEVKQILEKEHDVRLTRQDVYNIKHRSLGTQGSRHNDIEKCCDVINNLELEGGAVCVGKDDGGGFEFLFLMTREMRRFIELYPEVMILDVTYKTNMYLYPLLTAMVIDCEGHGIPVMHAFFKKGGQDIHGTLSQTLFTAIQFYCNKLFCC